jgi:hypothetical protein
VLDGGGGVIEGGHERMYTLFGELTMKTVGPPSLP